MPTKTTFQDFQSAKRSVNGRLKRLKRTRQNSRWGGGENVESPIKRIGCFGDEIDRMERTLKSMQSRLENATIKIPD